MEETHATPGHQKGSSFPMTAEQPTQKRQPRKPAAPRAPAPPDAPPKPTRRGGKKAAARLAALAALSEQEAALVARALVAARFALATGLLTPAPFGAHGHNRPGSAYYQEVSGRYLARLDAVIDALGGAVGTANYYHRQEPRAPERDDWTGPATRPAPGEAPPPLPTVDDDIIEALVVMAAVAATSSTIDGVEPRYADALLRLIRMLNPINRWQKQREGAALAPFADFLNELDLDGLGEG